VNYISLIICFFCLTLHAHTQSVETILQSANRAMDNELWSVASSQLRNASQIQNLTSDQKAEILSLLAEALIRDNNPSQALEILNLPEIAILPNTPFWKAQALAGSGNFNDATTLLLEIANNPQNEFFTQAALTAASLQLSLSQPEDALKTLELVNTSDDSSQRAIAILRRAEILLDLHRYSDARSVLSSQTDFPPTLKPLADLFDASLSLQEKNPEKASTIFSNLLANPQYQSLTQYSLAAIGKADSLASQNLRDNATETLLSFIRERPESPLLSKIFTRIIDWLPSEILAADHPTITALSEWIPPSSPEPAGLINIRPDTAAAAWPTKFTEPDDISTLSLYAKAIALRRIDNPAAKQEAQILLDRLRLLAPNHYISPRALLTLASWHLEDGKTDSSFAIFDDLRLNSKSPTIRGLAAFHSANIAFSQGNATLSSSLFEEASNLLTGQNSQTALLNSALAKLTGENPEPILIQHSDPDTSTQLNSELTLEQALSNPDPSIAKSQLDTFLQKNPDHPRATEARIAIIDAALASSPPDTSIASANIDTIKASQISLPEILASRLALAELRLLFATNKHEQAIALSKEILIRFENSPIASEATLIQGKSLFRSGNYNEARIILEKVATAEPESQRAQAALLLAARSAALGATPQSREEAISIFEKSIAIDGPLRSLAILEKARLLIDLNRIPDAIQFLETSYKALSPDDPSHLPTGLLLGEAIYANGDANPDGLTKALQIYQDLLQSNTSNTSQFFRLQYLRGLSQTRLGDALSTYFSVLDRPSDSPPPDWEWFERSGFRALALLENAGKWKPAISIAEKIASFNGPRADEAATRARQMRLKHMIWED
jgi:tetratricopeptide (TPR) repeat protein